MFARVGVKQPTFTPPELDEKVEQWYHPDIDGDGVGTGFSGPPENGPFTVNNHPQGWVPYKPLTNNHWDNCPETYNPNQEDSDNDGWGDVCDPEPLIPYNATQAK